VLYLSKLLEQPSLARKAQEPVTADTTACIEWGNNIIAGRERIKPIDVRKRFAHDVIQHGEMPVGVPASSQLADRLNPCIACCKDAMVYQM
jgi:hypothetical protein